MNAGTRVGRGQSSARPQGPYAHEPITVGERAGRDVRFDGEDGRSWTYRFDHLPCPGFHEDLAVAFAARIGPGGSCRTRHSADALWQVLGRFLRFVGTLRSAPGDLPGLRPRHLERYRLHRSERANQASVLSEMRTLSLLLEQAGPTRVDEALRDYLAQAGRAAGRERREGLAGYSEREFAALMAAARRDAASIGERLAAGARLAAAAETDPGALDPARRAAAEQVALMARTGRVPNIYRPNGQGGARIDTAARLALAGQVFLTLPDLAPLLVLMVGLSGRNGETIKELPAEHRVLGGLAVAGGTVKRRRGKAAGRTGVHWETGASPARRLGSPGGVYLLVHQWAARSREHAGTAGLWAVWTAPEAGDAATRERKRATGGHIDPFAVRLGRALGLSAWAAGHGLTDDDGDPLIVHLGRVKTTAEVRTAKAVGGHLPSASRTNTMDVSFLHYLRADPRVREWADQVLTLALTDAEHAARTYLPQVHPDPDTAKAGRETDTVFASCRDIAHSPFSGGQMCDVSFLTCLRCPNALIEPRHLPALCALLDHIDGELDRRGLEEWVGAFGPAWITITRLVLPRFTDAEIARARATKADISVLALLRGPGHQW